MMIYKPDEVTSLRLESNHGDVTHLDITYIFMIDTHPYLETIAVQVKDNELRVHVKGEIRITVDRDWLKLTPKGERPL